MIAAFSKDGFHSLRLAWATLALAVASAAVLAIGSYWYLQKEMRDDDSLRRQLPQAQARLDAARRERDDLRASTEVFRDLVKRGILQEENRLELVERLDRLKASHRLLGLEYEIAPQRPLPLSGAPAFNAVEVLGSRVKISLKSLHEGDALAFLEELARPPHGFNPMVRCHLQRIETGAIDAATPRVEAQCTLEWISLKDKRGGRAG